MWLLEDGGIATLCLLLVTILLIIYRQRRQNDQLNAVPGPKPYPIIGNIFEMLQIEAVDVFLNWSETYGKILKYKVFLLGTHLMVADADALKHILVTNSANYKKPEMLLIPVRMIFGSRCVICLPHEQHSARRKLLNPAFNASAIKSKTVPITQFALRLISRWKPNTVIEVEQEISRLTLDILGKCILGYEFACIEKPDNELVRALYRIASCSDVNILRFVPFYKYMPTRWNKDINLIKSLAKNVIKAKTENTKQVGDQQDMLDLMLQSRHHSTDNQLSEEDMTNDIILFIIAGHETATNVLCWTLYELARNPDIQQECRHEASDSPQSKTGALTLIECCIKEAMRLHPPVPLTCREAVNDDVLGGYRIPSGTVVALQLGAMMRHPDYFEDPGLFKPRRFLRDTYRHSFLPFLAGPDMCIGHKFAMLEMKIILTKFLQKMKFELTPGAQFKGCHGLTYHMKPPLFLKVTAV